jgi:hypothetical protein
MRSSQAFLRYRVYEAGGPTPAEFDDHRDHPGPRYPALLVEAPREFAQGCGGGHRKSLDLAIEQDRNLVLGSRAGPGGITPIDHILISRITLLPFITEVEPRNEGRQVKISKFA